MTTIQKVLIFFSLLFSPLAKGDSEKLDQRWIINRQMSKTLFVSIVEPSQNELLLEKLDRLPIKDSWNPKAVKTSFERNSQKNISNRIAKSPSF